MQVPVRTKLACEIACIDAARFNEAVARGDYRCAPATFRGSARLFNERQVLTLMIYGRLIHFGLSPATAGEWACAVDRALRCTPDADRIELEFDETGIIDADNADYPESNVELAYFTINVSALRERMRSEFAKEQSKAGANDEDDE